LSRWEHLPQFGQHPIHHLRGQAEIPRRIAELAQSVTIDMARDFGRLGKNIEQRSMLLDGLEAQSLNEVMRLATAQVRPTDAQA
jgi:hypothetical protein